MLSKFIYRCFAVACLCVMAQVGYSQNYVDSDTATDLLTVAISELESDLNAGPVYTGQFQLQADQSGDKIRLQLMKTVKEEISTMKSVKDVMDAWYDKAEAEGPARKTKLTLALDRVKDLLS